MRCGSCGSENPDTALRCSQCNAELGGATQAPVAGADAETAIAAGAAIDPDAGTLIDANAAVDSDTGTVIDANAPIDSDAGTVIDANVDTGADARTIAGPAQDNATPGGWSDPLGAGTLGSPGEASALPDSGVLSGRYEIVRLLGRGGMGAVYQARDLELDRPVAIKVIRPEFASEPEIIQRFKQELIMAREVTHPNVVRIFDLGSSEGFRYITMEFVAGRDLKDMIRDADGLDADRAANVLAQTCRALQAAHDAGIVHRDLKPQNIMIDVEGTVKVMDFGIARSTDITGMTRTGQMMGTPDYMSPEQAMAKPVDARSDIFSLGIIGYEMLSGELPYTADTPFGSLIKRTKEKAPSLADIRPDTPDYLRDIVAKCLQIEPDLRYQSAAEILADLEAEMAPTQPSMISQIPRRLRRTSRAGKIGLAAALVAAIGLATLLGTGTITLGSGETADGEPAVVVDALSLAILPFRNATGNAELDWLSSSLPEMLRADIGQSAELRTVSNDRVHQILSDLKITPGSALDPSTITRLGSFSNADVIVSGQYVAAGAQIRIDATLHNLERQVEVVLNEQAQGEDDLLAAVARLAATIRESMDLSAGALAALEAASFSPSTGSVEALRYFNEGLQLERSSNFLEAAQQFQAATDEDADFALAYSKLGQTYKSLGRDDEAETASRTAQQLSTELPDYERLLIAASHAQIVNDFPRAIEAYEQLSQAAPENLETDFELAQLYDEVGAFDDARQRLAAVLRYDPNYVDALYVSGRVEIRSGNPQGALQSLDQALRITEQSGNEEARARVLNAIGVAYMDMNQPDEALEQYQDALEIRRQLDDQRGTADTLNNIGRIQAGTGDLDGAFESYNAALSIRREIGDRDGIGGSLIDIGNLHGDRGEWDDALRFFNESLRIQRDLGNEILEAQVLNNIGVAYYEVGDYSLALTHYEQALSLREGVSVPAELAETLYNLGETSVALGEYDDSLAYYLRALDEARASEDDFLVAVMAQGLGVVHGYQGRFAAALLSHQEAFELMQGMDTGFWLYIVTAGHGGALSNAGEFEAAALQFDAALELAQQLDSQRLAALALIRQGRNAVLQGDYAAARPLFDQALVAARDADDGPAIFDARLGLATVELADNGAGALATLQELASEAGIDASVYLATETAITLAQAQLAAGDAATARSTLQRTINPTERLQLLALGAKAHYFLGEADRATGDAPSSQRHYREAVRLLDQIRSDGGDDPFRRADLGSIYENATERAGQR